MSQIGHGRKSMCRPDWELKGSGKTANIANRWTDQNINWKF